MFRTAALYAAAASVEPVYRESAEDAIERIEDTQDPALEPFRRGVTLLKARLALLSGRNKQADAVIARIAPAPGPPMVLYAPRIELATATGSWEVSTDRGDKDPQWADVRFTIGADGRVRDIELLRQSNARVSDWLDAARTSLGKRRYAPLLLDPADGDAIRIERYTLVEDRRASTRSRIGGRGDPRIDITDLTFERPKQTAMN